MTSRMKSAQCTLLSTLLLLGSCSNLLPRAKTDMGYFKSFLEAQQAVEAIVPGETRVDDLQALHLDVSHQPNAVILSYAEILPKVLGSGVLTTKELDPNIRMCIQAHDRCRGLEIQIAHINRDRVGPFFPDFINFRRTTITHGWRFNALILSINEVVIYRAWSGQPDIREVEVRKNPLGPLQDMGPAIITHR